MADNKQYITQIQDNGKVMISEEVIAMIVIHAVKDVEGIVSLGSKVGMDVTRKNWNKGMKIAFLEDTAVSVDCNVVIGYGQSVVNVAKAVQTAVCSAIESMTGVKVTAVNVNVCGIIRQ